MKKHDQMEELVKELEKISTDFFVNFKEGLSVAKKSSEISDDSKEIDDYLSYLSRNLNFLTNRFQVGVDDAIRGINPFTKEKNES